VIEQYHNPTDFQKFTVWLRIVPSVQGLRMRLDHFDEVRQFDRLRTALRAGVPGAESTQNSELIGARSPVVRPVGCGDFRLGTHIKGNRTILQFG
jgi:hypothetical protein